MLQKLGAHHLAPCPHCNTPTLTTNHDHYAGHRTFPAKTRIDPTPLDLSLQIACTMVGRQLWIIEVDKFTYTIRTSLATSAAYLYMTGLIEQARDNDFLPVVCPVHKCGVPQFDTEIIFPARPTLPERCPF